MNDKKTSNYLSDYFKEETFASMGTSCIYAIYSAPDTGKTTLITSVLQAYLRKAKKKALYLAPRRAIIEQMRDKVDTSVVTCWTYQKIEESVDTGLFVDDSYDFIICDEAHYFIEDAELTGRTDLSFNFINNSKGIILLMSGTPEYIECLKDSWKRPLKILADLDTTVHNVDTVCLIPASTKNNGGEKDIESQLESLVRQGKRIIVYDSNIVDLYKLYAKYKTRQDDLGVMVSFICSKYNRQYYQKCDRETLETLMDTQRTEADMLFITSALNTGVSIDEDFEYLFILGCPSKTSIFQLIARIRRGSNNRKIKTIYCSVPPYSTIRTRHDARIDDLLYIDNPEEWKSKRRPIPKYVYQKKAEKLELGYNQMIINKIRQDVKEYKNFIIQGTPLKAYKEMFEKRYVGIRVISLAYSKIIELLNEHTHLPYLDKDEQDKIKELCRQYNINTSVSKINKHLTLYNSPIYLKNDQKKHKGIKKQVWYIERYEN